MSWCVRGGDRARAVEPLGRRRAQELTLELRRRRGQRFQELRRDLGPQSPVAAESEENIQNIMNHRKYNQRHYELPKTLSKYRLVHADGTN